VLGGDGDGRLVLQALGKHLRTSWRCCIAAWQGWRKVCQNSGQWLEAYSLRFLA
jgi:hypothetical protein